MLIDDITIRLLLQSKYFNFIYYIIYKFNLEKIIMFYKINLHTSVCPIIYLNCPIQFEDALYILKTFLSDKNIEWIKF